MNFFIYFFEIIKLFKKFIRKN